MRSGRAATARDVSTKIREIEIRILSKPTRLFEIAWWLIGKVTPYERNARKLSESAVAKVAQSIEKYGWRQPIVVDRKGVIIAGHTRLLAAQKLGLKQVPVHVAKELSEAEARAYRLMDNRSHQESTWDELLLGPELADLKAMDFDLAATGFEPLECGKWHRSRRLNAKSSTIRRRSRSSYFTSPS